MLYEVITKIIYTCWMGMIRSNITVVSDLNNIAQQDYANSTDIQKDLFGGGSCSRNNFV